MAEILAQIHGGHPAHANFALESITIAQRRAQSLEGRGGHRKVPRGGDSPFYGFWSVGASALDNAKEKDDQALARFRTPVRVATVALDRGARDPAGAEVPATSGSPCRNTADRRAESTSFETSECRLPRPS